jgi:phage-related minor tail protein
MTLERCGRYMFDERPRRSARLAAVRIVGLLGILLALALLAVHMVASGTALAITIGDVFLRVLAEFGSFEADVVRKADAAGDKAGKSLAGRIKNALSPSRIGAVLGAAFGAVAVAAAKLGGQVDAAFDTIRTGTGATGEALKGLEGDFKAVAGSVRDDIGLVGQVIADLNKRTGQTGEGLRTLAKDILDLSRITGTDAVANVAAATRLFGDWSIATEDQSGALDKLFRTSQATGIGVTNLMETVVAFGSPMRLLGLSFEESIALLGKWEKEGVNSETALTGLKFSVKTLAREGVKAADMGEAFRRKLDAIKASSDPVGESIKVFGLRAGPDLAAAIIEGRFATEDLLAIINDTGETIATATADTEDFGDTLAKVFNKAKVEFGDAFSFLGSIGQTLGPLLFILPALTAGFGKLAGSIVGKAGPALAGFFQDISLGKQTGLAGAVNRSGAALGGVFAKAFAGAQIIGGAIASTLMKIPGMGAVRGAAVAAGSKLGGFMGSTLGKFAAVAFAAVAVVEVVATYNRIKGELGEQTGQISADLAKQLTTGTVSELEKSRAAVQSGLEKLEGVWDAGLLTGDTRRSLEANLEAINAELERRATGMGPTVGGALAAGEGAVTEGAEDMLDGIDDAFEDTEADARQAALDTLSAYASGLLDKRSAVDRAMESLATATENTMSRVAEVAKIIGLLTGEELAAGIAANDPVVRAQAEATRAIIEDRLRQLGVEAKSWGGDSADALAAGLASKDPAIRAQAERTNDIIEQELANHSQHRDVGGAIVEGIAEGMEREGSTLNEAARKLAEGLLTEFRGFLSGAAGRGGSRPRPGSTTVAPDPQPPRGALQAFAHGGAYPPFEPFMVGERGREIIAPLPPGVVIPDFAARDGAALAGSGLSIGSIEISVDASGARDPVAVGSAVRQGVADAMADILREQSQRFVAGRS